MKEGHTCTCLQCGKEMHAVVQQQAPSMMNNSTEQSSNPLPLEESKHEDHQPLPAHWEEQLKLKEQTIADMSKDLSYWKLLNAKYLKKLD